ncbi:HlyD family secretion protein [Pontiella sulfatireligans]|uniref:Multidrug resistance protein MdtN n=1 Tax=Pontiella sulfatireligans TaxID=2750658 RepID=A0A6C2UVK4_9BACT|nr:HlyD family secretion protein [Pontiella sulfatireligans]VGO23431.1 Multidrug resistance protein MdtN [Pontiella sulfatireligans]
MKMNPKYITTGLVVLVAVLAVALMAKNHSINPRTRDGQVRAEVIQITPRVSGPIINLPLVDNQFVEAGDVLFEIDPRTFEADLAQARAQYDEAKDNYVALEKKVLSAEANVKSAEASVVQAEAGIKQVDAQIEKVKAEYARQQEMLPQKATSQKSVERAKANRDVSIEERKGSVASLTQAHAGLAQAEAALAEAKANLGEPGDANASLRAAQAAVRTAELNLEFTKVRAPVAGYITNLNLRDGSQAVANQPVLALVDVNSYWIVGFFKENTIENIRSGNEAKVTLMSYPDKPIKGTVDSLGWGIAQQDGSTGFELLPTISPTFEWIRLAQRVPVRIHLDKLPDGVELRVGTTASILVHTGSGEKQ